jgi:hypothetical protein
MEKRKQGISTLIQAISSTHPIIIYSQMMWYM